MSFQVPKEPSPVQLPVSLTGNGAAGTIGDGADSEEPAALSFRSSPGTQEDQEAIPEYRTVLIQRTVRSGQSIQYPGHVVVMGDVNPGAEIVAGGNIIVLGCLRGVAHAGVLGDERAVVTAFRLRPTQLRIANHITRAPDEDDAHPDQPEIARIHKGVVVIEKYQPGNTRHQAY